MVNFRGLVRRLHPKGSMVKCIRNGFCFLALSLVSTVFLLGIYQNQNEYPYNTYSGLPLAIYEHAYNIDVNKTECANDKVVIVIHSAVTNFNNRAIIRRTWGNHALLRHYKMKLVFFLGMPFSKDVQILVDAESAENNDIVQGNFLDSYTNITHKAVLWLRWVSENCQNVQTVLKLDDDVFVNVFSFHKHLSMFETQKREIWCELLPAGTQRIQRRLGLKWRVAEHELKGLTHYPLTLCRGYFVVLTKEIIKPMYEAAKNTPFFWVDDFYIFGTLANKTGAQFSMLRSLASEKGGATCLTSKTSACHVMGVLLDSYSVMETFWKYTIQQQNMRSR